MSTKQPPQPPPEPVAEKTIISTKQPPPEPPAEKTIMSTKQPPPQPPAEKTLMSTQQPSPEQMSEKTITPTKQPPHEPVAEKTIMSIKQPPQLAAEKTIISTKQPPPEPPAEKTIMSTKQPPPQPPAEKTITSTKNPPPEPAAEKTITSTKQPSPEPVAEKTLMSTQQPSPEQMSEKTITPTKQPPHEPVAEKTIMSIKQPPQLAAEKTIISTQQPSPEPAAEKTILGRYQLGRLLGSGRFAKVFYARSLEDQKSVAIKVIDKLKTDPSIYPRIVVEVSAMRLLNHPNVLRIHEVMATKNKIYMVMELAKGGEISGKLLKRADHRFPEPIARRYFLQIVSALHYCHQKGVAHRDIKPQNLLLDEQDNVKVSDFGLSAIVEGPVDINHLLKTACGTPAFASPEIVGQAQTRAGYDGTKADAWSCGVMLFVMLTGYLPFDDGNVVMMYRKMIKKEYRFPSWVSKQARGLITRMLDPNPETRVGLEEVMRDPWLKSQGMVGSRSISLGDLASLAEKAEKKEEKKSMMMQRTASMNAFEIISMSSGLNLSGLFEGSSSSPRKSRESRFAGNGKGVVETVAEED